MPKFGALKRFSDSLATLDDHWETRGKQVTRQVAKWFSGLESEKQERGDWEETASNMTRAVQQREEITGVFCLVKRVSLESANTLGDK